MAQHDALADETKRLSSLNPFISLHARYALGRAKRFSLQVQRQLVAAMASVKPDVVLITGDLTSQALESEFELARTELQGLLDAAPRGSFVIPGNHCVYTRPAAKQRLLQRYFGKWMDDGPDVQVGGEGGVLAGVSFDFARRTAGAGGTKRLNTAPSLFVALLRRRVVRCRPSAPVACESSASTRTSPPSSGS